MAAQVVPARIGRDEGQAAVALPMAPLEQAEGGVVIAQRVVYGRKGCGEKVSERI
ncbi:hypothetical protein [Lysobacter sp. D1-1-M9]|uniref:hypothetical protein n=1 Tax=Novilysobacter longmucuonensis TaxID=3098603 RepID=UPI002FCA47E9